MTEVETLNAEADACDRAADALVARGKACIHLAQAITQGREDFIAKARTIHAAADVLSQDERAAFRWVEWQSQNSMRLPGFRAKTTLLTAAVRRLAGMP